MRRTLLSMATLLAMLAVTFVVPVSGQQGRGGAPAAQEGRGGRGGAPALPPGPIPRRADGKPDLSGVWLGSVGFLSHSAILEDHPGGFGIQAGPSIIIDPPDGVIPYQPWALQERDRRKDDANGYEDEAAHCERYSIGRLHQFAQEFIYSGNSIVINVFRESTRVIPMDRRQHLPEGIRLWLGDSLGRWEGDTLVIDSTNFNDHTRMGLGGDFFGPDAHLVERYTVVDANTINWTMTLTNPKVFTRPWTIRSAAPMTRQRVPGDDRYDREDGCHEGNVDLIHLKNVYDQTRGDAAQSK